MSFIFGMEQERGPVIDISGPAGHAKVTDGTKKALRKAIALVERHHKTKEWVTSAPGRRLTGKGAIAPHPTKLTVRTRTLLRSCTRRVTDRLLSASYGTNVEYGAIHEFSPKSKRKTFDRTAKATAATVERMIADAIAKEF